MLPRKLAAPTYNYGGIPAFAKHEGVVYYSPIYGNSIYSDSTLVWQIQFGAKSLPEEEDIGNYDIVIETKAKNNSTREERFTQWVELIKSGFIPQEAMNDILPLVLDDSDSSVSNKVRKILAQKAEEAKNNPMAQQIQQLQMQMQQLQLQVLQATAQEKQAKAMKYTAQANADDIKLPKGDK